MLHLTTLVPLAGLAGILYLITLSIHRLFFHRAAHIPGPRLAALTYYYQAYYDIYPHKGQFMFHCADLHKKYGPVIRIGPDEVHVNDLNFYHELYANVSRPRDKSPLWFWMSGVDQFSGRSAFTTLSHDLHRLRRSAFGQYFSRQKVMELQPLILDKVMALKEALLKRKESSQVVDLRNACGALTLEVITEYTFGKPIEVLHTDDFAKEWNEIFRIGVKVHPLGRAAPWLMIRLLTLPGWIMRGNELWEFNNRFERYIENLTTEALDKSKRGDNGSKHLSVLYEMLNYKPLPAEERELKRLNNDASIFVGAGMETTGRTLAVTLFHILANQKIYDRLREELLSVMPASDSPVPTVSVLEKLPYLTAILHEGIRVAHGVAGRLARIAPEEDLVCNGTVIPRGVTISESNYLIHMNPDIFPEPHKFRPERFMGPQAAEALRSSVMFGKGMRMCVGINLAWAELYLTIATLVRFVKMELVDTTERDVTVVAEYFLGFFPEDSKGIRARILGEA